MKREEILKEARRRVAERQSPERVGNRGRGGH